MPGTILLFGRNAAMMTLVERQLAAEGMNAVGFMDEEELIAELNQGNAHLLVIGGGVEDEPRARVKEYCHQKGIMVFEHSGGPQNLPGNIASVLS
jgi:ribosomal protein L30E